MFLAHIRDSKWQLPFPRIQATPACPVSKEMSTVSSLEFLRHTTISLHLSLLGRDGLFHVALGIAEALSRPMLTLSEAQARMRVPAGMALTVFEKTTICLHPSWVA